MSDAVVGTSLLLVGFFGERGGLCIAAGLFAIACHLGDIVTELKRRNGLR